MSAAWEYLLVRYTTTTNLASKAPGQPQTWKSEYGIYRPHDSEGERRPGDIVWSELLNELGNQGWELVAERIDSAVIVGESLGWYNPSLPISISWTFKRSR